MRVGKEQAGAIYCTRTVMEMWEGLDHETQERIAAAIVEAIANNYGRVEIVVQRGMVTEVNLEKSWRRGLPSVQPKGSGGA